MKKELRYMGRRDLLRILLEVQRENESLQQENASLREQLEQKRIDIEQFGSIAEAAMQLNHVFEDAQRAADQYVENARLRYEAQQTETPDEAGEAQDDGGE